MTMTAAGTDRWATPVGTSVTIEGVRLAYWRTTDERASTVIMLHGMRGDHAGLAGLADRLDAGIIAPDLPGYGRSEPLTARHTLIGYADVVEQLRRQLGLVRFTLLGHSLGGSIALVYASRYGAALDGLCLLNLVIDTASPATWLGRLYYGACVRLPRAFGRVLLTSRPAVYLADRAMFTSQDQATRRRILRQEYAIARTSAPSAVQEAYLSLAHTPFDQYAAQIQTPTVLVTGDHDPPCTPRSLSRLQQRIPQATVDIVPDARHLLPVGQPDAAAVPVNQFLARPPRCSRRAATTPLRSPGGRRCPQR